MDAETMQMLLDLLSPLHESIDAQTIDRRRTEKFEAPAQRGYIVAVTARQERDLTQAVMILRDRLHRAQKGETE